MKDKRMLGRKEFINLVSAGAAGLIGVIISGCALKDSRKTRAKPNIVLISIDTLRRDYFSPEYMPLTYQWAKENAVIYTRAYSNSTWTLPSHCTMLTGLLPNKHKVELWRNVIPENLEMIQERFKKEGYQTAAFTGGCFISSHFGFNRGFENFLQLTRWSDFVMKKAFFDEGESFDWMENYIKELNKTRSEKPVFLFLHTYIVHEYPLIDGSKIDIGSNLSKTKELYAMAVEKCDKELMDLLNAIQESPISDNIRILITSDHGEGFGEVYNISPYASPHLSIGHGGIPNPSKVEIPLIIYDGDNKGQSNRLVGLDEVAGALLDFADIDKGNRRSLFDRIHRRTLVSEFVPPTEDGDPTKRHIAKISRTGYEYFSVKNSLLNESMNKNLPQEIREELRTLGYIN